ncbi:MAG: restriction endonuclease subunit S [Chlorobiales bacterium]|nr:restriction endonuclease subunit S [Chlorobiales bacterium]
MNNLDTRMSVLEKYFDTAFAAPEGIKKLRELILTLAMQGKLVPQDPNDQPASELLKEIEAEKRRLVKAGKIREPKQLPEIKPEEVPHALPKSWEWVRFGTIAQHNSGKMLDKSRNKGQYREYITTSNLYWGQFDLSNVRQMPITDEEIEKCTAQKGDLLLCEGGEAGRAAVWCYDHFICFQNHVHRARFYKKIDPYYGYRFFEKLNATGEINNYRQGVGISNMSGKVLGSIVIPLPPLAEQRRIVAKIDQLMARCDELEKLRAEREEKRLTVHISALNSLLEAQEPDSFVAARHFINRHFGELYSVKENVTDLRKAILQLAVMGKLVPQDPNDQPASELLKEIEAEKLRLVKAGKIKPQKPLPEIKSEDVPYELPVGWKWVRLGELIELISGQHLTPNEYNENGEGIAYYTGPADFGAKNPRSNRSTTIEKAVAIEDDILLTVKGAGVGKTNVLVERKAAISRQLMALRAIKVNKEFLLYFLTAIFYELQSLSTGIAIPGIGRDDVTHRRLPLPPHAEQHRIVAKIDQLMALCDQLEQQINAAACKQSAILDAVMVNI